MEGAAEVKDTLSAVSSDYLLDDVSAKGDIRLFIDKVEEELIDGSLSQTL